MNFVSEVLEEIVGSWIAASMFVTGELLRWALTLGRRRVHWWNAQDDNIRWPSILLGVSFWTGIGALVWLAL